MNIFSYTQGNPLNRYDALGLICFYMYDKILPAGYDINEKTQRYGVDVRLPVPGNEVGGTTPNVRLFFGGPPIAINVSVIGYDVYFWGVTIKTITQQEQETISHCYLCTEEGFCSSSDTIECTPPKLRNKGAPTARTETDFVWELIDQVRF